jgi:hypothetical protein
MTAIPETAAEFLWERAPWLRVETVTIPRRSSTASAAPTPATGAVARSAGMRTPNISGSCVRVRPRRRRRRHNPESWHPQGRRAGDPVVSWCGVCGRYHLFGACLVTPKLGPLRPVGGLGLREPSPHAGRCERFPLPGQQSRPGSGPARPPRQCENRKVARS